MSKLSRRYLNGGGWPEDKPPNPLILTGHAECFSDASCCDRASAYGVIVAVGNKVVARKSGLFDRYSVTESLLEVSCFILLFDSQQGSPMH